MNRHFCADCDLANLIRFEHETFSIDHAGLATEIKDLSGWRCTACGQIEFDTESAQRYAAGGDELVLQAREFKGTEISVSAENQA
jgi:HTH-type transcriptional regulator/antitoxin MqsA